MKMTTIGGVALSCLLMPIAQSMAQEAGGQVAQAAAGIEEIVVTAQKRQSSLIAVTAPISVLSNETISRRGIADFEGLIDQIPGVSITSDFGGDSSKVISIRGVGGTDDYRPNGSPSVAFHVDNIYQTSNVFVNVPFFDVERVEVLKGPQGTLYGRNSTAGVINLITRGSGKEQAGYANVEYASFDSVKAEGAYGGPLSESVGIRVAALVDQGGGYLDGKGAGPVAGRVFVARTPPIPDPGIRDNFGDRDLMAGRATLDFAIAANSSVTIKAYGSRDRGEVQFLDSVGGENRSGFIEPDNDPYTFFSTSYPERDIKIWGLSGDMNADLGSDLQLDVVAGYQSGERFAPTNIGSPVRRFAADFSDEIEQRSLEVRLSQSDEAEFSWILGAYYLKDKVDFFTLLYAEDISGTRIVSDYAQKRTSKAVFGEGSYPLSKDFNFSLGLRYTSDDGSYAGSTVDLNPFGVTTARALFPLIPVFFNTKADDSNLSGRGTLSYMPSDALNIYASFGKGYKAGGFDGSTIFSLQEAEAFKPEDVSAYELGAKFSYSQDFYLSTDLFYYDFKELQAFTVIPLPDGGQSPNLRTNVGKSRFYGADITLNSNLVKSGPHTLSLEGGATLLSSKIQEFEGTPAQVAANLGNELPAAAKFSANASLSYTYAMDSGWNIRPVLELRRKSAEFKRLNNNLTSKVPGHTLWHGRVDIENPDTGLGVFAYVRNLTDDVTLRDLNAGARLVGPPRLFGVGAKATF